MCFVRNAEKRFRFFFGLLDFREHLLNQRHVLSPPKIERAAFLIHGPLLFGTQWAVSTPFVARSGRVGNRSARRRFLAVLRPYDDRVFAASTAAKPNLHASPANALVAVGQHEHAYVID